jgi:hypothetical protein
LATATFTPTSTGTFYIGWHCFSPGDQINVEVDQISVTALAPPSKALNLKLFLEGLYAGSSAMNKARGISGEQFPGTTADQVTVELHSAETGALVFSVANVDLSTSGLTNSTIPAVYTGSYFIYIKNHNHLLTCTANPVSFAGSTISYDFSTGLTQAFGSNMKIINGVAILFGGDENQDGIVGSTDIIDCENDGAAFASGYINSDINGDGVVDISDLILIDNNNAALVHAMLPF